MYWLYIVIVILVILLIMAVNSHPNRHEATRFYPRLNVKAVYKRTDEAGVEDGIYFTFNEPGHYILNFRATPGHGMDEENKSSRIPPHSEVTVTTTPLEYPVTIRRIAKNLEVTVHKDGRGETKDFA